MRGYIKSLIQRFNSRAHFVEFVGVSKHTVNSWTLGKRQPSDETLRLLEVLGVLALESPHVFNALTGKREPIKCKPIVILPPLEPLPVGLKPNDRPPGSEAAQIARYNAQVARNAQPNKPTWTPLTDEQRAERDARTMALDKVEHPEWFDENGAYLPLEWKPSDDFLEDIAVNTPKATKDDKNGPWSDSYWFDRTVTEYGDTPAVLVPLPFLRSMTEGQEAKYWHAGNEYARRTGRILPDL